MSGIFPPLEAERAEAFAALARSGLDREYPNKPAWVHAGPGDARTPREQHPVFYGCFDWHSAVHSHWLLARVLRRFPGSSFASEIRATLDRRLEPAGLAAEAEFFDSPAAQGFERPYGWSWALALAAELFRLGEADPDAARWSAAMEPLERCLVQRWLDYLPRLSFPVRSGMHTDTAFGLAMALDHARVRGEAQLEQAVSRRAVEFYGAARSAPAHVEPGGEDFFSPTLNIADLLTRVMDPEAFAVWLEGYLPHIGQGGLGPLDRPVPVSDPTDGRLAHLAGLNLSRAWCFARIAEHLPGGDPRRAVLAEAARLHGELGGKQVFSGDYMGDHWLATFAVFAFTA